MKSLIRVLTEKKPLPIGTLQYSYQYFSGEGEFLPNTAPYLYFPDITVNKAKCQPFLMLASASRQHDKSILGAIKAEGHFQHNYYAVGVVINNEIVILGALGKIAGKDYKTLIAEGCPFQTDVNPVAESHDTDWHDGPLSPTPAYMQAEQGIMQPITRLDNFSNASIQHQKEVRYLRYAISWDEALKLLDYGNKFYTFYCEQDKSLVYARQMTTYQLHNKPEEEKYHFRHQGNDMLFSGTYARLASLVLHAKNYAKQIFSDDNCKQNQFIFEIILFQELPDAIFACFHARLNHIWFKAKVRSNYMHVDDAWLKWRIQQHLQAILTLISPFLPSDKNYKTLFLDIENQLFAHDFASINILVKEAGIAVENIENQFKGKKSHFEQLKIYMSKQSTQHFDPSQEINEKKFKDEGKALRDIYIPGQKKKLNGDIAPYPNGFSHDSHDCRAAVVDCLKAAIGFDDSQLSSSSWQCLSKDKTRLTNRRFQSMKWHLMPCNEGHRTKINGYQHSALQYLYRKFRDQTNNINNEYLRLRINIMNNCPEKMEDILSLTLQQDSTIRELIEHDKPIREFLDVCQQLQNAAAQYRLWGKNLVYAVKVLFERHPEYRSELIHVLQDAITLVQEPLNKNKQNQCVKRAKALRKWHSAWHGVAAALSLLVAAVAITAIIIYSTQPEIIALTAGAAIGLTLFSIWQGQCAKQSFKTNYVVDEMVANVRADMVWTNI